MNKLICQETNPSDGLKVNYSSIKSRLDYLDGLRAIAAIYVVICHALLQVKFKVSLPTIASGVLNLFKLGIYAVDIFIVLSGFCLMLSFIKSSHHFSFKTLTFLKKRARRILPPYYLAIVLSLLLIVTLVGEETGTHWDLSVPVTFKGIVSHLTLLHDCFPDVSAEINHALWSISVEWRIYLFFPLLILAWQRMGALVTTVLSILLSYFLLFLTIRMPFNVSFLTFFTPRHFGLFTLGMLAAEITFSKNLYLSKLRQTLPWITLLIGFSVNLAILVFSDLSNIIVGLLVGIWGMLLLITLARKENFWLTQALSWKPLVFVGMFSYSIYLIHAPLLQVIWQYMLSPLNLNPLAAFSLLSTLGTALIVGISYLFFLLCERPFLKQPSISLVK